MTSFRHLPHHLTLILALTAGMLAHAQGHGGGGPGGGMGGGGMSRGPFGGRPNIPSTFPSHGSHPDTASSNDGPGGGSVQLAPPGRWWDNGKFAQSLGLDSRQQRRMDDIFGDNKGTLVQLYKNLQHEQSELAKAVRARELDEPTIFQQIDRVAQARAELEKANAHMLLQIRKEMSPEQAARLDDHRPEP